jgi:eukaryotic-like serine/threonine-protein kinase
MEVTLDRRALSDYGEASASTMSSGSSGRSMYLAAGSRLGLYEIIALIGAGGMGEVYRARDTKLGRGVALKILPDAVAADPDRISRFEREAKALAALNHPHIAALFGMEESGGRHFLAMELVEGETLAERLARGPLAVEDALTIALQIADALEAAHAAGIVHRDLKPANLKITPDEQVKVLDFGLARAMETAAAAGQLTNSPTLSMHATQAGVILGTAAYMSPEQAKGVQADHRSDVFSFGVVLHEMLTGRQPFRGDTAAEIMASVMVREADLSGLLADLNPRLVELLRRCLEKSPKKRWQAIGDVRAELEVIAASPRRSVAAAALAPPQPLWRRGLPFAITALIAGALGGAAAVTLRPPAAPPVVRFALALPEDQTLTAPGRTQIAISPDGTKIVYVANFRLYLRTTGDLEARPIQGAEGVEPGGRTSGVTSPAFSPDGEFVAFFSGADNTLKKIPLNGGVAITVCPAGNPFGLRWGDSGIVFGQGADGIMRVSPNGGISERVVSVQGDEFAHGPEILPGGRSLLMTLTTSTDQDRWDKGRIVVQPLGSGERKVLIDGGSDAHYSPTGHLVYALRGVAFAVPFDLGRLETTGPPVPVVEGVRRAGFATGAAQLSFSSNGSLIYVPGPVSAGRGDQDLAWVDRTGVAEPLKLTAGSYQHVRVSRDGKRVTFGTDDGKEAIVYVYAPGSGASMQRVTFEGKNRFPIWAAGDTRIAFQSDRDGDRGIFWQPSGGGKAERLTKADEGTSHVPEAWAPSGDTLLYTVTKGSSVTLWALSLKEKAATRFGTVESNAPIGAVFSPDGQWIAYAINNTVYVQPFPPTGSQYQVSKTNGGHHPIWSSDGKELFYEQGQFQFVAVPVRTQPGFTVGHPVSWPGPYGSTQHIASRNRDIAPDGTRFISPVPAASQSAQEIRVVVNWFEELKRRVPTK